MVYNPPQVFLQDACALHEDPLNNTGAKYVHIERPERIRAVKLGLAAVCARLEATLAESQRDISVALSSVPGLVIKRSNASTNILQSEVVRAVHGSLAESLAKYCERGLRSTTWAGRGANETHGGVYDLYLVPESMAAINGAVGTVLEAVDAVCDSPPRSRSQKWQAAPRAFVVIRPPGHHCDRSTPAGFCYVNNVMIAAEHAYRKHNIKRIVIFDIDLHHGNGSQRLILENRLGPRFFLGGIHDAKIFPCNTVEGAQEAEVQVSMLEKPGCLGIHNVRLREHRKVSTFWETYKKAYSRIIADAAVAIERTGRANDVLVIISCGFDASEHEDPELSHGNVPVPTEFYRRFTAQACAFADKYASGRLVSVLEGGYCDNALISGTIAHVGALAQAGGAKIDSKWWAKKALDDIAACTSTSGGPAREVGDPWLKRTQEIARSLLPPSVAPITAASLPTASSVAPSTKVARPPPAQLTQVTRTSPSTSNTQAQRPATSATSVQSSSREGNRAVPQPSPTSQASRAAQSTSSILPSASNASAIRPSRSSTTTSLPSTSVPDVAPLRERTQLPTIRPATQQQSATAKRHMGDEAVVPMPAKKPRVDRLKDGTTARAPLDTAGPRSEIAALSFAQPMTREVIEAIQEKRVAVCARVAAAMIALRDFKSRIAQDFEPTT